MRDAYHFYIPGRPIFHLSICLFFIFLIDGIYALVIVDELMAMYMT